MRGFQSAKSLERGWAKVFNFFNIRSEKANPQTYQQTGFMKTIDEVAAHHIHAVEPQPKKFYQNLTVQVLTCVTIGVLIGHFFPDVGTELKPLGDVFVKMIKMCIAPIVFLTIVTGISAIGDLKKVGKVGVKALIYFEIVTTLALAIGLVVVNLIRPGDGIDRTAFKGDVTKYASAAKEQSTVEFFLNIVPDSVVNAFAKGELLQVLFFSILFGIALSKMGEMGKTVEKAFEKLGTALFGVIAIVMRFAPIGALGAMAFTIGKYGLASLIPLAKLMLSVYATSLLFIFLVLGSIAWFYKFNIITFIRYINDELLIVLGTSSSESVLPRMLEKMQRMGCGKSVVGLVIPTGYSFNLDGTCIYLSMAAIFISQAYQVELSLVQQLSLLGILLITSKGAAAVTGGGFITLAATLAALGTLPVEGMALLLGVDRFMSEARALTNLIGNGVATIVVAKSENEFDEAKAKAEYKAVLNTERL
jgi:aerobic C4-dicarboxylate transport protein